MNPDLIKDPEDQQRAAEAAFVRSAEYTFLGKPVQPFSFTRQRAADMLGLRYGNVPDVDVFSVDNPCKTLLADPDLDAETRAKIEEQPAKLTVYRGLMGDVAIVLWLMHQPAEIARKARANPSAYDGAIDEWAEANGLGSSGVNQAEAVALFSSVMADLAASRGQPDMPPAKGESGAPKNA